MSTNALTIGTTYITSDGLKVTAINNICNGKALFVCNEFPYTPYVSWYYNVDPTDDLVLFVFGGSYYTSLTEALNTEKSNSEPKPLTFTFDFYCPDCGQMHTRTIEYAGNLQDFVETIEDYRIICPGCSLYMFLDATKIRLSDGITTYTIPLWHGAVSYDPENSSDDIGE